MPITAKQGPAFNIPTYYPNFFDFLYSLIKFNIKQAITKIKNKDNIPLTLMLSP